MNLTAKMEEELSTMASPRPGETSGVFSPEFEKLSQQTNPLIGSQMMKSLIIPIVYVVITIVGISGNSIVIYIMKTMIKKHSVTDIYIINLAAADLLLLTTLPVWAADLVMDKWMLGDVMCKIVSSLTYLNLYASIFFLTAMSIDRWSAIVKAVACRRYRTIHNAKIASIIVWMLGGFSMIVPLAYRGTMDFHGVIKCSWMFPHETSLQFGIAYNVIRVGFGFFLPLLIIVICYGSLISFMYQRNKRASTKSTKGSHIVTKMIFGVITCFVLCWLPNQVTNIVTLLKQTNVIDCHLYLEAADVRNNETYKNTTIQFRNENKFNLTKNENAPIEDNNCSMNVSTQDVSFVCTRSIFLALHLITVCLGFSNSMMNPILYFFLGPKYRNKLKQLCGLKKSRSDRRARRGLRNPANLPILLKSQNSTSSSNKGKNSNITRSPWKLQHSRLSETSGGLFGEHDESEYFVPSGGFRRISSVEENEIAIPINSQTDHSNKRNHSHGRLIGSEMESAI